MNGSNQAKQPRYCRVFDRNDSSWSNSSSLFTAGVLATGLFEASNRPSSSQKLCIIFAYRMLCGFVTWCMKSRRTVLVVHTGSHFSFKTTAPCRIRLRGHLSVLQIASDIHVWPCNDSLLTSGSQTDLLRNLLVSNMLVNASLKNSSWVNDIDTGFNNQRDFTKKNWWLFPLLTLQFSSVAFSTRRLSDMLMHHTY